MQIRKEYWVEYAHRLQNHPRQCKYIHGHSGRITITLAGPVDDDSGMIRDFGDLKWLGEIVNELDHALVLEDADPLILVLQAFNNDPERPLPRDPVAQILTVPSKPTAENLCRWLQQRIHRYLIHEKHPVPTHTIEVMRVEFEETRGNSAIWSR